MGRLKGCINKKCVANQKKVTYKEANDYCSKCGNELYYVCVKCYTQLPVNSEKYCVRCIAKKKDDKDQAKGNALKIGGAVLPVVGIVIAGSGKKVVNAILKLK